MACASVCVCVAHGLVVYASHYASARQQRAHILVGSLARHGRRNEHDTAACVCQYVYVCGAHAEKQQQTRTEHYITNVSVVCTLFVRTYVYPYECCEASHAVRCVYMYS